MSDKDRVLLVNKFYYPRGGDCIQMMAVERLLKKHGHEVAVFSMQYPQNTESEYSGYFPEEVKFSGGAKFLISAAKRVLGYGGVKSRYEKLLADFSPEIVHLHNIHSYISPVVAEISKKHGCRVVWTLHDYKLACPTYSCLANGRPCEDCFTNKISVLKNKCMKGSIAASIMAYVEAEVWNVKRLCRSIDTFICPSKFMAEAMIKGGIPAKKIETLSNFIDTEDVSLHVPEETSNKRGDYYCYIGRLSEEKGVETLLKAAEKLPYKLKVAGTGPLYDYLKAGYSKPQIEFLGHLGRLETMTLLSGARFSILPSEWYENNPLGVIESLCVGTPVLGSDIGGIPELINHTNGILFKAFDMENIRETIERTYQNSKFNYEQIAREARDRFSADLYYKRIIAIYNK